jgi:hypothetical protein
MLPDPATLLEQFAKGRDRSAVAAGGPLRDRGYSRLCLALSASKCRQCKRGSGSNEQTTPCCDWHVTFLPVLKFDVLTASFVLMTVMDFRIANNLE